jgi:hypothetical protein
MLNKAQTREVSKLAVAHKLGMSDMVARSLSALVRSSMRSGQRAALMEYADLFGVRQHPEFII